MKFTKPPLSLPEQADTLLGRGMTGDRDLMIQRLQQVSYYRLSGYWYPFRQLDPAQPDTPLDDFKAGTTFDEVWTRYVFDRCLRLLVLDAIERIEVSVRSQLAYHHAHTYGLFSYATDANTMPGCSGAARSRFMQGLNTEVNRSKDTFVKHFQAKYGDEHAHLPVWMAVEIMNFGSVLTFYRGSPHRIKQDIASVFDMPAKVFDSWLLTLNTVRNICAHHGRLWNREIGTAALIPRANRYPDWHQPTTITNNRVFVVLTICKWSLDRIAPQTHWADRLFALLSEYPAIPRHSMGFPTDWEKCPIWSPTSTPSGVGGTP
jgi:abortive infection bacteriophage resistance protein